MLDHVTALQCVVCHQSYAISDTQYTCPKCGIEGILDVIYDYEKVSRTLTRDRLQSRPYDQWRYLELLPIAGNAPRPHLQTGWTPIYHVPRLASYVGIAGLYLKDDGRNPTASFKDRASAVGVVKARECGADVIACASTGNAASSLAGMSASMGLKSFIFVPEQTPEPKVAQLLMFGATVFKVRGSYEEAYNFCQEACRRYGWYNRNGAINPYLVEGKKTAGLEIAEQLADTLPDWVILSVGDGCTIAGVYKGLLEMHKLGISKRVPKMLGVQAEGARPIVDAFLKNSDLTPATVNTVADSIAVGTPRNWRKAIRAIRESKGSMVTVTDDEIRDAMRYTARLTAVFAEPAAAAAVAGLKRAITEGVIDQKESALVVITGNGLKDVRTAIETTGPAISINASMKELDAYLEAKRVPK